MRLDDSSVMDPATVRSRILRKRARRGVLGAVILAVGVVLLTSLGGADADIVVVASIGVAVVGATIMGVALVGRVRPRPTVQCARCGALGWSVDLRDHAGRCPRCASLRLYARGRYRTGAERAVAVDEPPLFGTVAIPRATVVLGADIAAGDFVVAGEADVTGTDDDGDNGNGD